MLTTKYYSLWLAFVLFQLNPLETEEQIPKIAYNQKVIKLTPVPRLNRGIIGGEKTIELKVKLSAFKFELKKNTENAVDIKIKGASPIPEIKETKNKDRLKIDIYGGVQSYTYFFQNLKNRCDIFVPDVPLDLDISISGNSSVFDFSGLSVTSLKLLTGGNSKVSFPTPNSVKCEKFYICTKFSNFKGEWLGNANADNYYFSAGAGNYTLDFRGSPDRGEATGRKKVEINVGMGMLKLVFPDSCSVRLKSNGVYVKSTKKLAKDENGWYIYDKKSSNSSRDIARNVPTMTNEFIVHIEGSLGIVGVEFL